MLNPFDENTENNKFQIFKGVTDAINDWMLKKYPEFDNSLISKMRKLELDHQRLQDMIRIHNETLGRERKDYIINVTKQINNFLAKDFPDIDGRLKILAEKLEKNAQKVEEKLKKVVDSQSLYEDVYKLRDEFKTIQTFIDGFQKKIKKAFDI